MKISDLANVSHVGPVRLTGGREVFRFVRWTRGRKGDKPRLVTLGRINGIVGNCSVSHRYVSPETEVELVKPPLTFAEYQEGALRTAVYPKERGVDYTFMGLAGETAEFQEKIALISARVMAKRSVRHDLLCELGDVCWYIATASHEVGITLAELPVLDGRAKALRRCFKNPVEAVLRLANALGGAAGKLPNKLKKTIRDGKQISEYREDVIAGLGESLQIAKQIAETLGSSIEQVMADNLAKLRSRADRGVLHGSGDNR